MEQSLAVSPTLNRVLTRLRFMRLECCQLRASQRRFLPICCARRAERQQWETERPSGDFGQDYPPPPPPPPPPYFEQDVSLQDVRILLSVVTGMAIACDEAAGNFLATAIISGAVALGFLFGFNQDEPIAVRRFSPSGNAVRTAATEQTAQRSSPPMAALPAPAPVASSETPVGLQPGWDHRWKYDANGQAYVELQGRWWLIERPAGTKMQLVFTDLQNKLLPGARYVWKAPVDWPMEEIDLTNQKMMSILCGRNIDLLSQLELMR